MFSCITVQINLPIWTISLAFAILSGAELNLFPTTFQYKIQFDSSQNNLFLTHGIKTLRQGNDYCSGNGIMLRPKPKNSTIWCRYSYTSSHVSSYESKNLLVQSTKDKPRNTKIVLGRNSPKAKSTSFTPTTTAYPLEGPPGTRSGTHGILGVS